MEHWDYLHRWVSSALLWDLCLNWEFLALLQNITAFRTKLVALPDTINHPAMKMIARSKGIKSNYESNPKCQFLSTTWCVNSSQTSATRWSNYPCCARNMSLLSRPHIQFAIHLMTTMTNQAVAISAKLKSKGLSSEWQTSEDSNTSRINKMSDWTAGKLNVLTSTMNCRVWL